MDYEKKYKEDQKWIEGIYPNLSHEQQMEAEAFFPELKESEDEKTRKRIIALVNAHGQGMYKDDMLAWLKNIPYTIDHEKREGFHLGYKAGLEKQGEQKPQRMISAEAKEALYDKPVGKAEPFDKYEGLTDFERTLADICIGWIGEEPGWKQYIKDNSDVLLRIATEKFNSVQDAPSEQKPAWSEEDEKILNAAILHIKNETYNYYGEYSSECIMQWLKSLKDRVQPRDDWKPSYEQMDALNTYIYNPQYFNTPDSRMELVISIYEDLKKLMEE